MQMQLTAEQRDLIYAGRKTVHRIPADGPCRYEVGRAYRVKVIGEDKPMLVTIVAPVSRQTLADVQARDALREGARHLRDFLTAFAERHADANLKREVYVIEIAPGDLRDVPRFLARGGPAPICKAIDKRDGKVCNRAFAVGQERCKCGAKRPLDRADDNGYTMSRTRAIDDAEAVSAGVQEQMGKRARKNRELGRSKQREELLSTIAAMRATADSAAARKRLRSVEHHLRALEAEAIELRSA